MITPFDRQAFIPETTPADWAPHESSLKPHAMDGALLFPIQSHVVRTAHHTILIDTCVGNDQQRPNRPAWHMKSDDRTCIGYPDPVVKAPRAFFNDL
jgi:hypothetical protein